MKEKPKFRIGDYVTWMPHVGNELYQITDVGDKTLILKPTWSDNNLYHALQRDCKFCIIETLKHYKILKKDNQR